MTGDEGDGESKPPVSQPGRASATPAPSPAAGTLSKTFIPKTVHDRVGKGPFKIESEDGLKFNTFDEKIADMGRDAVTMKAEITVYYIEGKFGLDIKSAIPPKDSSEQ